MVKISGKTPFATWNSTVTPIPHPAESSRVCIHHEDLDKVKQLGMKSNIELSFSVLYTFDEFYNHFDRRKVLRITMPLKARGSRNVVMANKAGTHGNGEKDVVVYSVPA